MIILYVLSAIILLLILIAVILLYTRLSYEVSFEDGVVKVYVVGFCIYNSLKTKKHGHMQEKRDKITIPTLSGLKKILLGIQQLYKNEKTEIMLILKSIRSHIELTNVDLAITYGFGDAAVTGIANGIIWSALTLGLRTVDKLIPIKDIANLALAPKYDKVAFEYKGRIVFKTTLIKFWKEFKKLRKIYTRNKNNIEILKGGNKNGTA